MLACTLTSATDLPIISFGDAAHTFKFVELNDPVMGGKSTGTWAVDSSGEFGVFDGEVVDVPSLSAPGFIKASSDGSYPDLSTAAGGSLLLRVRSTTPEYGGFRLAFASGTIAPSYACSGGGSIPFSRGCFKAKFSVPAGSKFATVRLPLSAFSDMWSPATGEHTKECSTDADVCPSADKLKDIKRFEVWAEGAKGKVHLEIESISAETPAGEVITLSDEVPAVQPLETVEITKLATFDGSATTFTWIDQNDPVMGGASTSSFKVEDSTGVFNGTCAIVGFLKAPGFAKITSQAPGMLNDASAHINGSLQLMVRSSTPSYSGFKVAFAAKGVPKTSIFGGGSFKASFTVKGSDWQLVDVPFNSFSYDWSGYTGRCDTKDPGMFGLPGKQHHCCGADHPEVCPTAEYLQKITDVELWAEGVEGDFHIEVKEVQAAH